MSATARRRCAACRDDALDGGAFCALHAGAFVALYGYRAIEQAQEEKTMKRKRTAQVVDVDEAKANDALVAKANDALAAAFLAAPPVPGTTLPRRVEQPPVRRVRDKAAEWKPKERSPGERVRDPRNVRRLFKRFLDAASPARVDYVRLDADEQAVAGLLQQLALTAFGDGSEGSGFRDTRPKTPMKWFPKSAASLYEGAVVRYKKPSEQAEVYEDAGVHPITVVQIRPAFVRVACGAVTFTPKANQIELDPDAEQPPRPDDTAEVGDERDSEDEVRAGLAPGAYPGDGPDLDDDVPFGADEDVEERSRLRRGGAA